MKEQNIKEKTKEAINKISEFVVDTGTYIINHPVAATLVLIPTGYFYAMIIDMLSKD